MSANEDTHVLAAVQDEEHDSSSVFGVLRARRAERTADQTFDVEVPGYQGLLVLQLGPIPGKTLTAIRARAEKSRSPERDFNANADFLIAACRDVLVRRSPDDELHPADEEEPMRLDARLASSLGLTATSARDVVRQTFGAAPSPDLAVAFASQQYLEWAAALGSEEDEALLGE